MVVLHPIALLIGGPVYVKGDLIYPPEAAALARSMWIELVRETAYNIAPDARARLEHATSVADINNVLVSYGITPFPDECPFVESVSPLFVD